MFRIGIFLGAFLGLIGSGVHRGEDGDDYRLHALLGAVVLGALYAFQFDLEGSTGLGRASSAALGAIVGALVVEGAFSMLPKGGRRRR